MRSHSLVPSFGAFAERGRCNIRPPLLLTIKRCKKPILTPLYCCLSESSASERLDRLLFQLWSNLFRRRGLFVVCCGLCDVPRLFLIRKFVLRVARCGND